MVGIIVASLFARPLIPKLGRKLVVAGLAMSLAGAVGIYVTVLAVGGQVNAFWTVPSVFVLGVGMGTSIASIYDVAIGTSPRRRQGAPAARSAPCNNSLRRSVPPSSPLCISAKLLLTEASTR